MIIAENELESALAQVFADDAPGRRRSFAEIAQAWGRLGLRLCDLRDAIRAAVDQHDLRSCGQQGELVFELTAGGQQRYRRCREQEADVAWPRQTLVPG